MFKNPLCLRRCFAFPAWLPDVSAALHWRLEQSGGQTETDASYLYSVSSQSTSKSPLLASKLRPCPLCAQTLSFSPPTAFNWWVTAQLMYSQPGKEQGMGVRGRVSGKTQQPISSQLDCRIHTRWAFGGKGRSAWSSSIVSCLLSNNGTFLF